jgi:hypothetical protein
MTISRLLGAAAILSAALATPAMAQQVISNPGYCAQFYPNANCQNKGPNNPYTGDYQRRIAAGNNGDWNNDWNNNGQWNTGWHDSWQNTWQNTWNDNRWDRRDNRQGNRHDSGFWPGDVAAGVVGSAVGTADAIATAPFRGGDSYAYYNGGTRRGYDDSYAARNGFVCQPGTWFKGEDGRRHPCQ